MFKVWHADNEEEADAIEIADAPTDSGNPDDWALDAADAAETYVDQVWRDLSYPDDVTVCVRSPDGALSKWSVRVQMVPAFEATEIEG